MALPLNEVILGANNPVTEPKTDEQAATAWDMLQILKAADLNGLLQYIDIFAKNSNNEIANALETMEITPDAGNQTQLAQAFSALKSQIAEIIVGAPLIGSFWFGLTGFEIFTIPNPTDPAQNYLDFTTNTPYKAKTDLSGWDAQPPLTIPAHDVRVMITSKFWDIVDTNNLGGTAYWSDLQSDWSYFPTLSNAPDNVTIEARTSDGALQIKDGGVTNAKLATMPTNTIKANNTSSAASPSDVPINTLIAPYLPRIWVSGPAIITSSVNIIHELDLNEPQRYNATVDLIFYCVTANQGYAVGDMVYGLNTSWSAYQLSDSNPQIVLRQNTAVITFSNHSTTGGRLSGLNTSGAQVYFNTADWRVYVRIKY